MSLLRELRLQQTGAARVAYGDSGSGAICGDERLEQRVCDTGKFLNMGTLSHFDIGTKFRDDEPRNLPFSRTKATTRVSTVSYTHLTLPTKRIV